MQSETSHIIFIFLVIGLVIWTSATRLGAAESGNCKISDLRITAQIPKGYRQLSSECPKVSYIKNLKTNHAMGFYISENQYPYHTSDEKSQADTLDDYILIVQYQFDQAYKGTDYETYRIDEYIDFPTALIEGGGTCGGLEARLPLSYQSLYGVEWRRGVLCLVQLPPTGPEEWRIVQAFFFYMNLEDPAYKPKKKFKKAANKLFRSIEIKR